MRFFSYFLLIIFFSKNSLAIAFDDQIPPKEIAKNIDNPRLLGSDQLKFFGFKIYDIALWSQSEEFSYNQKFAISIKYNKFFGKDDLIDRSIVEIRKNYKISDQKEKDYKKDMLRVFNDVFKGDTKTVVYFPHGVLRFYHNSQFNGKIEDKEFAREFVDIWLHYNSSYPKITMNLLGKKN